MPLETNLYEKCSLIVLKNNYIIIAQENLNTSIKYIHNSPESFLSKMIKLALQLLNQKKAIEKDIRRGKIKQEPASVPKSLSTNFRVDLEKINGRKVWTVKPNQNSSEQVILYIHGGAYIYNIYKQHWQLIEQLLEKTGATIVVPDYPLSPKFNCTEVFVFMHTLYQRLLEIIPSRNISFMGDSAGGGLAFALAQNLKNGDYPLPKQMILLSPWLDVTMTNPDILAVDKYDKLLGIKGLQLAGEAYADKLDLKDYRVSPINGDLNQLPKISIFIGTHDLFIADSRKLKSKLESANILFNYFEYSKMMHVWTIFSALKEAKHSVNEIVKLVNN